MSTRLILFILALLLCVSGGAYVALSHPKFVENTILALDTGGLTDIGRKELNRRAQISALPIPIEQKEVLLKKQIFKGASVEMAQLALGSPRQSFQVQRTTNQRVTVLVYVFDANQRPTLLRFINNELDTAQQGYAGDIAGFSAAAAASSLARH